jgi:O-antigen ligase
MNKFLNKKNIFVLVVVLLATISLSFLIKESVERTIFISLTLFIWLSIFLYTKDLVLSSLLYILIVLPFNVTMQLPLTVGIFNTQILFPPPFVSGIYVNYLIPTISILDVGVILFLLSLLIQKGIAFYWKIFKDIKNGLSIFLLYLIIQNIFLNNMLGTFNSLRLFLYLVAIISTVVYYNKKNLRKILFPAAFIIFLNVLVQGVIGVMQVLRGASLGLKFLGESQVVSGMQGSSFISLGERVFLRAYGTFPHPNVFAGFLILALLLGIACSRKFSGLGISLAILSFSFLLFTFSRSALLLGVLILVILFLRSISRARSKMFSLSPLLFLERFENLVKGGDSSWTERVALFKASVEVVKENFLLGTGVGNFVKAMGDYSPRTTRGILLLQPVHNIFVLVFAELGFLGFLGFFYILVKTFLENVKKVTYFKVAVLLSILIIGFWDHYLFSLPQGLAVFMFLYLLLVLDLDSLDNYEKNVDKD